MSLLEVSELYVRYPDAQQAAVSALSFSIAPGESLGIVGESGAGKTQTALAIMGLLPANAATSGRVAFDGTELLGATPKVLNRFRAERVGMIFQDPLASLNPYLRIGAQLRHILLAHDICPAAEARERVLDMLQKVGLPDADRQYAAYPHELSGGMRQRAMIGAALLGEPDLLIADEPTTALDVTVQAQILNLLDELRHEMHTALLLITHDLGVVAGHCDRLLVMDDGALAEEGPTREIFKAPATELMQTLLKVAPDIAAAGAGPKPSPHAAADIVLEAKDIAVSFAERGARKLHAVRPTDLSLCRGETVAIVGESGSGKTSLARALVGLVAAAGGRVSLLGDPLALPINRRAPAQRRQLQMVFQDPQASLNPAMRVIDIVSEPLQVHMPRRKENAASVKEVLERVGLGQRFLRRFPHELSGGQAQRVAIARALILDPAVLICDEAVAALDGSVQEEILQLLGSEQQRTGLSIIFITHDLAVVRQLSHRVAVMYLGRICELATSDRLFARPRHPYTKALLNAVPTLERNKRNAAVTLSGEPASIINPPAGCPFHPRCEHAIGVCSEERPVYTNLDEGIVACHRAEELDLGY